MSLELTGRRGDQGARDHLETRASQESLVLPERKERQATRGTQDLTVPPGSGAALEREDHGGPQARGDQEETLVKLAHKVIREEKAPLVSLETRARLALSDLKATEAMRVPQGPRVPEEPQDLLDPLETLG